MRHRVSRALAAPCLAVTLALAPTVSAQLRPPLFTLQTVIDAVEDRFGNGLAIAGDAALVASYLEDTPGAASLYDLATGAPIATVRAPDPSENDGFGHRVAASRRLLAVASVTPAAVHLYDRRLRPLGAIGVAADPFDPCGAVTALAVHGRRVAVATPCRIVLASGPDRRRTVERPAENTDGFFGWSVALAGTRLVVGSPHFLAAPAEPGRVLAFDVRSGMLLWDREAPEASPGDAYGASLAVVGSRVLVGAPRDDGDGTDTGAAYLIDAATGAVVRRYANPSGTSGTGFGDAVAGDRRVVLVGAPGTDVDEPGAGVGYVLDARTGAPLETLAPRPNEADANAGRAVAVTRSRLLVGGSDWSGEGLVGVYAR